MLENWKEMYKIERIRKDKTKYKSVGRWAWENGKAVKTAWKSREENSQARQIERAEKKKSQIDYERSNAWKFYWECGGIDKWGY